MAIVVVSPGAHGQQHARRRRRRKRRLGAGKRVEAAEAKAFDPWNPGAIDYGMASPYKTVLGAEARSGLIVVVPPRGSAARLGGEGRAECTASGDRATLTPRTNPGTRLRNQLGVRDPAPFAKVLETPVLINCLLEVGSRGSRARAWQGAARPRKGRLDPSRAGPATRISCGRPVNRLQPVGRCYRIV